MAVLALHDLSCYSKSSITVVLPVMEALGVETAVIPTAILSTQTDGFDDIYSEDREREMLLIYSRLKALGISFDGVYSGYLSSESEIDTISSILSSESGLKLVDPVMGDGGELYQTITRQHAERMAKLVRKADVITPNFTEAMILSGLEDGMRKVGQQEIHDLVSVLRAMGPEMGVITSVPLIAGGLGNIAWKGKEIRMFQYDDLGVSYPGSGDLFASVLFALLVRGESFFGAVSHATGIATYAIAYSKEHGRERRLGIELKPVMDEIRRRAL